MAGKAGLENCLVGHRDQSPVAVAAGNVGYENRGTLLVVGLRPDSVSDHDARLARRVRAGNLSSRSWSDEQDAEARRRDGDDGSEPSSHVFGMAVLVEDRRRPNASS